MFQLRIFTFFSIGLFGFLSSNALAGDECAKSITTKCEVCHQVDVICAGLEENSKNDWEKTVSTMIEYGAELSQDEEAAVVTCLCSHDADVTALCK